MNKESLINLSYKEALSVLRSAPGSVSLVVRRNFLEEPSPLLPDSPVPPENQQLDDTTDCSSEEADIPLPPDSPLPPERPLQESILARSPLINARQVIESPLPTLRPQESSTSIGMEPPKLPSSPLPSEDTVSSFLELHESVISLETEQPPPIPSASLLPQESSTSLEIEPPSRPPSLLFPQDSTTSLGAPPPPPSSSLLPQDDIDDPPVVPLSTLSLEEQDEPVLDSSDELSDIDDFSPPPLPSSDDEAPPPGPHSPLPLDND